MADKFFITLTPGDQLILCSGLKIENVGKDIIQFERFDHIISPFNILASPLKGKKE